MATRLRQAEAAGNTRSSLESFRKPQLCKGVRMIRHVFAAAAILLAIAGQALASEPAKPKSSDGQYVDLAPVALPIVVEGQLINYVFVSARLQLSPSADAAKLRAKEPFFRDALVRAGHKTPFTNPNDYTVVDVSRLQAVLLRDAALVGGYLDGIDSTKTAFGRAARQAAGISA